MTKTLRLVWAGRVRPLSDVEAGAAFKIDGTGIKLRSDADSTLPLPTEGGTGPEEGQGPLPAAVNGTGSGSSGSSGESVPRLLGPNYLGRKDPEHPERGQEEPSGTSMLASLKASVALQGTCPTCQTGKLDPQLHYKLGKVVVCRDCWTKDAIANRGKTKEGSG